MDRRLICLIVFITLFQWRLAAEEGGPTLFQLNWGVSPNTIDEMLESKDFQFQRIIDAPSSSGMEEKAIRENERIDLENAAALTYYTEGVAYFDIPSKVRLSFYNPDNTKERLSLYEAEIHLMSKDTTGKPVDLKTLFRNLLLAFVEKYSIPLDPVDESRIFQNFSYSTVLFDMTISFSLDLKADNLVVTCENLQYKELVEAKIAEIRKDKGETVAPAGVRPRLVLAVDVAGSPFVYNTFSNSHGDGISLNTMCGVRLEKWVLGGAISYEYSSFDGFDPASSFHGAWALLGASFHAGYDFSSWFRLDTGIGSGWLASSFQYADQGLERKNEPSVILYGTPEFKVADRITVKTPVRVQLNFGGSGVQPNVYAAGRAEFKPFLDWLGLYAEVGAQLWVYSGGIFNSASGLFVFSLGSHVEVPFGSGTAEKEGTK